MSQKKTCKKCGGTEFDASGHCKQCRKEYYANNSDKIKERIAKYRTENNEKIKEGNAKYYSNNSKKLKERNTKYRSENLDRAKEYHAQYRVENAEKIKELHTKYRADNAEKIKESWRRRYANNPGDFRKYWHSRRARIRGSGGALSKGLMERLFKLQRGKCACCKLPLGDDYHLDHIMPIALGGANTDDNIQLLRARCNHQKHAKHPVEFMQSRGYLL